MVNKDSYSAEEICTHLGDDYHRFDGAVVPPIYQNSLFVFEDFNGLINALDNERENYLYSRGTNPSIEIAEQKIAALEGGEICKLFSSGMAAITSSLLSFLEKGDHVLMVSNIYGPTRKLLNYLDKFGIEFSTTKTTNNEEIESNIKSNTKVIYLESPTTMTFELVDLHAVSKIAKAYGVKTIIDNTWATPINQTPISMGIDLVVHSASKYLSGHSDLIGGAIIGSTEMMNKIFYNEFQLFGGVMPPFEAWLLLRGLRTLPLRMKEHMASAMKIANFLQKHNKVKKVNYPGLTGNDDYELGKKMLKGYSGLLSFELKKNDFKTVEKFIDSLKIFKIGVSWGGFESLVLSPNHGNNEEDLIKEGVDPGLIRISVGLEKYEALLGDLDAALNKI